MTNFVLMFSHQTFDLAEFRKREITAEMKALYESSAFRMSVDNGVATIPILGPIIKSAWPGEVDPMLIVRDAARAAADDTIKTVMLKIDSPGGTVAGTAQAADAIAYLASKKKVYAYFEDSAYSAAYFIGSQATKIYMNATGGAGSIGVRTMLIDDSKYLANLGITVHNVTTGKFKAVGAMGRPITEEDLAYIQGEINALFDAFVDAVNSGRKISKKAIREMEARIYIGQQAVDAGLVDAILPIESVYGILAKEAKRGVVNSRASAQLALSRVSRFHNVV